MLDRISDHLGIRKEVVDAEAEELSHRTAVGELVHQLRERLPPEEG